MKFVSPKAATKHDLFLFNKPASDELRLQTEILNEHYFIKLDHSIAMKLYFYSWNDLAYKKWVN